jgi:hypothetical protein
MWCAVVCFAIADYFVDGCAMGGCAVEGCTVGGCALDGCAVGVLWMVVLCLMTDNAVGGCTLCIDGFAVEGCTVPLAGILVTGASPGNLKPELIILSK